MPHHRHPSAQRAALALIVCISLVGSVFADEERHGSRVPLLPKYQQECGSCHAAFAPRFLPAASWRQIMSTLPRHYGSDASLDPASVAELSKWLEANAGSGRRVREAPPEHRITRSRWFVREHDEISAATWKLPAVKSASNCAACHPKADQGDFNEHAVRVPR